MWLEGACWSSGWIQNHTEQETRPSSSITALLWHTCSENNKTAGSLMHGVLQVTCIIVSFVTVQYHFFYSIYTKVVVRRRVVRRRRVPQFPVRFCFTEVSLQTFWRLRLCLLWDLLAELCRESTERIRTLGFYCWKTLIFYFPGLHDGQKSLPKKLHEKTTHTKQNTLKWQSDCH